MGSQGEGRTRNPAVNSRVLCQLSYLGSEAPIVGHPPESLPSYLTSKIAPTGGCWLWMGAMQTNGYGSVGVPNEHRTALAHRAVYELLVGPIPDGFTLDHLCQIKLCVNPVHLEPVTRAENIRRAVAARPRKIRCKRGHDTTAPGSRDRSGMCRECKNERQRAVYAARQAAAA